MPPPPPASPSVPLYLLEVGAAGSSPDAFGMTPLDIAVRHGRADVVRGIFRETGGAPGPCAANCGLLYEAVRGGDAGIVEALVGAGWEAGVPGVPPVSAAGEGKEQEGLEMAQGGGDCGAVAPPAGESAAAAAAATAAAALSCSSEGGGRSGADDSPAVAAATTAAVPVGSGETLSPLMLAADR